MPRSNATLKRPKIVVETDRAIAYIRLYTSVCAFFDNLVKAVSVQPSACPWTTLRLCEFSASPRLCEKILKRFGRKTDQNATRMHRIMMPRHYVSSSKNRAFAKHHRSKRNHFDASAATPSKVIKLQLPLSQQLATSPRQDPISKCNDARAPQTNLKPTHQNQSIKNILNRSQQS